MIRQMIIFGAAGDLAFRLTLQLVSDRVALTVNSNGLGDPFGLERIELDAELAGQDLPLYGRLLWTYWRVTLPSPSAPTRPRRRGGSLSPSEGWAQGLVPLLEYPAGSDGHNETVRQTERC